MVQRSKGSIRSEYKGGKMMNNIKLGFSWIGLIVFLLPMLINILYVILPPKNAPTTQQETNKILEIIEQSTRMLYMLAIVFKYFLLFLYNVSPIYYNTYKSTYKYISNKIALNKFYLKLSNRSIV